MCYYFVSDKNFDNQIVYPRVPKTIATHEDNITKRICVAKSIHNCCKAITDTILVDNKILYAHSCISNNIHIPTYKQVGDADVTGEQWILEPVTMKLEYIFDINKIIKNRYYIRYVLYDKRIGYGFSVTSFDANKYCWDQYNKKKRKKMI